MFEPRPNEDSTPGGDRSPERPAGSEPQETGSRPPDPSEQLGGFFFQITVSQYGISYDPSLAVPLSAALPPFGEPLELPPAPDPLRTALENDYVRFEKPACWEDLQAGDVIRIPASRLLVLGHGRDGRDLPYLRVSDDGSAGVGALKSSSFDLSRIQEVCALRSASSFESCGAELLRLPSDRRERVAEYVAALLDLDPSRRSFSESAQLLMSPDGRGVRQLAYAYVDPESGRLGSQKQPGGEQITLVYRSSFNPAECRLEGYFESALPDMDLIGTQGGFSYSIDTNSLEAPDEEDDGPSFSPEYDLSSSLREDDGPQPMLGHRVNADLDLAVRLLGRLMPVCKLGEL